MAAVFAAIGGVSELPDTLYWEAHITTEPVFDDKLDKLVSLGKRYKFRVAELLLKKHRRANAIRSDLDSFMTSRSDDYDELKTRVFACVAALQAAGFQVWRYKIEAAVLDVSLTP